MTIQPVLALWAIFARIPREAQWLAPTVPSETPLEPRTSASATRAPQDNTAGITPVLRESSALKVRTALPGVHCPLSAWPATTVTGKVLKCRDIDKLQVGKFMLRYKNDRLLQSLTGLCITDIEVHSHHTR